MVGSMFAHTLLSIPGVAIYLFLRPPYDPDVWIGILAALPVLLLAMRQSWTFTAPVDRAALPHGNMPQEIDWSKAPLFMMLLFVVLLVLMQAWDSIERAMP